MHFRVHGKYEKSQRRIAATFLLRHGDVLVMDGAGVQEYYEWVCSISPRQLR